MKTLRVAIIQNSASRDAGRNRARLERRLARLPRVDLIALPEVFALRGSDTDYRRSAEPLDGPLVSRLAAWARDRRCWLLAGSIMEKAGRRVYNTSVLLNRSGRIAAAYRKIHLFEAHLDNGKIVREADVYSPGRSPVMADVEGWQTGLAICYDIRFPELFRLYADRGATLMLAPSNFTRCTGRDHWDILVRARAIENQCFLLAPNQCGANAATGIASHGHSLAVGPWGEILGRAANRETTLLVELDPARLRATRTRIPALQHRRL